jgi:hypothetical protein
MAAMTYEAWWNELLAISKRKKHAKAEIERLKRDAIAVRLEIANAKLHLADVEGEIETHRTKRPERRL